MILVSELSAAPTNLAETGSLKFYKILFAVHGGRYKFPILYTVYNEYKLCTLT